MTVSTQVCLYFRPAAHENPSSHETPVADSSHFGVEHLSLTLTIVLRLRICYCGGAWLMHRNQQCPLSSTLALLLDTVVTFQVCVCDLISVLLAQEHLSDVYVVAHKNLWVLNLCALMHNSRIFQRFRCQELTPTVAIFLLAFIEQCSAECEAHPAKPRNPYEYPSGYSLFKVKRSKRDAIKDDATIEDIREKGATLQAPCCTAEPSLRCKCTCSNRFLCMQNF